MFGRLEREDGPEESTRSIYYVMLMPLEAQEKDKNKSVDLAEA